MILASAADALNETAARMRASVADWKLHRARDPGLILDRPKIVGPHITLSPRFALDEDGKWVVSHGPFIVVKDDNVETLKYVTLVLNSAVGAWMILHSSDRYGKGYALLEPKTLRELPIIPPKSVARGKLRKLLGLYDHLLKEHDEGLDVSLDEAVADIYDLSPPEREIIGFGGEDSAS
jgi:hypothetical protein